MKVRLAAPIVTDSIVDGEGLRTVIWMQGCNHNCEGCHNPETHDFNGGFEIELDELLESISNVENQSGITLSGGDPLFQPQASLFIAQFAHSIGLNVWCYSGYTFEQILKLSDANPVYYELLKNIDVLVDGKFELQNRSLSSIYRGSTNQRIVDISLSLMENKTILKKEYYPELEETNSNKGYVFI